MSNPRIVYDKIQQRPNRLDNYVQSLLMKVSFVISLSACMVSSVAIASSQIAYIGFDNRPYVLRLFPDAGGRGELTDDLSAVTPFLIICDWTRYGTFGVEGRLGVSAILKICHDGDY